MLPLAPLQLGAQAGAVALEGSFRGPAAPSLRAPSWRCSLRRMFAKGQEAGSNAAAAGLTIAALLLLGGPAGVRAQASAPAPGQAGIPFMASWDYRDYGAHSQNWAIVQDPRGIIYVGNGNGVLQYDGGDWRVIPVANSSIVRSLAVDLSGTVYVGAVGELGVLRPDDTGSLDYVSLVGDLAAADRDFSDVWRTWATGEGIYFWTAEKLFRWRDGRYRAWSLESSRVPALVGGRLYNNQPGAGLTVLGDDDTFHPIVGGEELGGASVMFMLPHGEDGMLIGSRDGELRRLSWTLSEQPAGLAVELDRFETEAGGILARHQLYTGARLPGGGYALSTMTGGSVVIDSGGGLRYRFTRAEGLLDESVWGLYVDREHGLWHGLNRGLVRFELGTPITTLGETAGLEGTVEALCRSEGKLYVATNLGLYRLVAGRVEKIGRRGAPYWSLLAWPVRAGEPGLLVGATDGVFEFRGDRLAEVLPTRNAFVLQASTFRPGLVWVGDMTGAGVLQRRDGEWLDAGRLAGVDKEVRSIVEDGDGRLWLGTHYDGVLRVTLTPQAEIRPAAVESFGPAQGLTSIRNLRVLAHEGQVLVATKAGLFRFDPGTGTFVPSAVLGTGFGIGDDSVLRWSPDARGNIWLSLLAGTQAVAFRRGDGTYELDRNLLRRLDDLSIHAILPESGAVWFGGVQGLFRFDTAGIGPAASVAGEAPSPPGGEQFSALIRGVSVAQPGGRTLFGGDRLPSRPPVLTYAESSLRFDYAMPRFDGSEDNLYRSRLVGLEESWSDWTDETYRDFTALREGRYRFEVQGLDVYHRTSDVATFDLRVLPPWYRTWWAYSLCALALAAATGGLLSWQLRRVRLKMEVQRLAEANAMMRRTEKERQQFVGELEAKNSEMERFIYTVSHDLKSPLISVRGFIGMLERDMTAGDQGRMRHDMERIRVATGKMAHLVEDLLELSTVGRQTHEPQTVAMVELARAAADQVAGLIAERRAEVVISPDLPPTTGDRPRLEAMLQNLIENGLKYMGEQPSPRIEIDHLTKGDETIYRVRDNGIGIDPRYQEKIFGLFERLSTEAEGTGVGLALVKRTVEVHGGRVWVESEGEGKGSTFCFTLPGSAAS